MPDNIEIIVLGKTTNDKGNSFENFLKTFLRKQGYTKITSERHTGMQIDFTAVHNFTKTTIFGEAKGYRKKNKVKNDNVLAFMKKCDIYKEKSRLGDIKPIFVTTSDYTWEIDDLVKNTDVMRELVTINGKELIERLRETEFIPSMDLIDALIQKHTPFTQENKFILIFNGEFLWLQIFKDENNHPKYFAIFNKDGNYVKHYDSLSILDLLPRELSELIYIDLDLRFKILEFLISNTVCQLEDIVLSLRISEESIRFNLEFLNMTEQIVKQENQNEIRLTAEIEGFRQIFKEVYDSRNLILKQKFFLSDYYQEMVDDRFINYILNRFFIASIESNLFNEFKNIVLLFPDAMQYCLFGDTSPFSVMHKRNANLTDKNPEKCNLELYDYLKLKFQPKIMEDFFKNQLLNRAIFHGRDIKHIRLFGGLFLLKNEEPYLYFEYDNIFFEVRNVSGMTITEGGAVKYNNNQSLVNAIVNLIKLKDFKSAATKCRNFLKDSSLNEYESFFRINMGVAYLNLEKFDDAIQCFEEALTLNQNIPKIFSNLVRAWYFKSIKISRLGEKFRLNEIYIIECLLNAKKNYSLLTNLEDESTKDECIEEISQIRDSLNSEVEYYSTEYFQGFSFHRLPYIIHEIKEFSVEFAKEIIIKNSELFESLVNRDFRDLDKLTWYTLAEVYMAINENEIALSLIEKGMKFVEEKINILELLKIKGELLYKLGNIEDASMIYSDFLEIDENDLRIKNYYAEICWGAAKVAKKLNNIPKFEELKSRTLNLIETHCEDQNRRNIIYEELSNY